LTSPSRWRSCSSRSSTSSRTTRPLVRVKAITDRLAPGSYVVISHVTSDEITDDAADRAREVYNGAFIRERHAARATFARFFDGLDLVLPGLVDVAAWRSGRNHSTAGRPVLFYAGIAASRHRDGLTARLDQ